MMPLLAVVAVLLFFGLTVFVHELGHFIVARLCGMKIDVFSIGFGPAIWKRIYGGITYKIGAFPLGGYVALPQMDPTGGERAGKEMPPDAALPPVAPWKRILVSLAGATGNILFAILLAWVVFYVGKPSSPHESRCVIGFVAPGSQAWDAGLRTGDSVEAANGETVENWQDLITLFSLSSEQEFRLLVRSPDADTPREIGVTVGSARMGMRMPDGVEMESLCRVERTMPDSPAAAAGVQPRDRILALDGIPIRSIPHMVHLLQDRTDREVPLQVRRNGEALDLSVRPVVEEDGVARIGIQFSRMAVDFDTVAHPRPGFQLRSHATAIFRFLRALVTPRESRAAAGAVGGPLLILVSYWELVRESFMMAVWFTVFLNVNLAVLNLLPIPVLDGGHILFALYEVITRRPVPPAVAEWAFRIFASLLIAVFLLLTFRDTLRMFFGR